MQKWENVDMWNVCVINKREALNTRGVKKKKEFHLTPVLLRKEREH